MSSDQYNIFVSFFNLTSRLRYIQLHTMNIFSVIYYSSPALIMLHNVFFIIKKSNASAHLQYLCQILTNCKLKYFCFYFFFLNCCLSFGFFFKKKRLCCFVYVQEGKWSLQCSWKILSKIISLYFLKFI